MAEEDVEFTFYCRGVTLLGDGELGAEVGSSNGAGGGVPATQRSGGKVGTETVLVQTSVCWASLWKRTVSVVSWRITRDRSYSL